MWYCFFPTIMAVSSSIVLSSPALPKLGSRRISHAQHEGLRRGGRAGIPRSPDRAPASACGFFFIRRRSSASACSIGSAVARNTVTGAMRPTVCAHGLLVRSWSISASVHCSGRPGFPEGLGQKRSSGSQRVHNDTSMMTVIRRGGRGRSGGDRGHPVPVRPGQPNGTRPTIWRTISGSRPGEQRSRVPGGRARGAG